MCDEDVKELANVNTGMDLLIALHQANGFKRHWMLETDFLREREKIRQAEHRELMRELRQIVDHLRALYSVNMRVLNLIKPAKTGEQKHETDFSARFDIY